MKKFNLLLLLLLTALFLNAQTAELINIDHSGTFMIYLSPLTTKSDIEKIKLDAKKDNINFVLSDLIFDKTGNLLAFHAEIPSACESEEFIYKGMTDLNKKDTYPIAVLFSSPDCSTGVYTTSYDNASNMENIFLQNKKPQHKSYGWKGDFDDVKNL